jgi:hypothetical protein
MKKYICIVMLLFSQSDFAQNHFLTIGIKPIPTSINLVALQKNDSSSPFVQRNLHRESLTKQSGLNDNSYLITQANSMKISDFSYKEYKETSFIEDASWGIASLLLGLIAQGGYSTVNKTNISK